MNANIVDCLRIDPEKRTLGELLQDRERALHEIGKRRGKIERLRAVRTDKKEPAEIHVSGKRAFRPGALIRTSEVCELVGTSRSTIYRWVSEGTFPEPVRISERAVR